LEMGDFGSQHHGFGAKKSHKKGFFSFFGAGNGDVNLRES